jgi:hypothetical protein
MVARAGVQPATFALGVRLDDFCTSLRISTYRIKTPIAIDD